MEEQKREESDSMEVSKEMWEVIVTHDVPPQKYVTPQSSPFHRDEGAQSPLGIFLDEKKGTMPPRQ
jgi:hypothetical protein